MKLNKTSLSIILSMLCLQFIFADAPDWLSTDFGSYNDQFLMVPQVNINGTQTGESGDLLGAFSGDEVRGVSEGVTVTFGPNSGKLFFDITMWDNAPADETITFKFYDLSADGIIDLNESYPYQAGVTLGNMFTPETLTGDCVEDGAGECVLSIVHISSNPSEFTISQNYPNPFNPITSISFDVAEMDEISLIVYDLLGKEVITLASGTFVPGRYIVNWNAVNNYGDAIASGMYVYRYISNDNAITRKMLFLK